MSITRATCHHKLWLAPLSDCIVENNCIQSKNHKNCISFSNKRFPICLAQASKYLSLKVKRLRLSGERNEAGGPAGAGISAFGLICQYHQWHERGVQILRDVTCGGTFSIFLSSLSYPCMQCLSSSSRFPKLCLVSTPQAFFHSPLLILP